MPITRKLLVGRIHEILPGRTKAFAYGHAQGIAYNDGATIKAYINKCTHMGGPVELKAVNGQAFFRCRWHEAEFDPGTGAALRGQAPAQSFLTPITLVMEGEQVFAVLEYPDDPFSF